MPLLDHFHPPLHGPRRWEGFHHAWAASIATQLNQDILPPDYFAEPEVCVGPKLDMVEPATTDRSLWLPSEPILAAEVSFAQLDTYEVRVYQDVGGAQLRGAVELVSPANKD